MVKVMKIEIFKEFAILRKAILILGSKYNSFFAYSYHANSIVNLLAIIESV